jgi:hypothetical protein
MAFAIRISRRVCQVFPNHLPRFAPGHDDLALRNPHEIGEIGL